LTTVSTPCKRVHLLGTHAARHTLAHGRRVITCTRAATRPRARLQLVRVTTRDTGLADAPSSAPSRGRSGAVKTPGVSAAAARELSRAARISEPGRRRASCSIPARPLYYELKRGRRRAPDEQRAQAERRRLQPRRRMVRFVRANTPSVDLSDAARASTDGRLRGRRYLTGVLEWVYEEASLYACAAPPRLLVVARDSTRLAFLRNGESARAPSFPRRPCPRRQVLEEGNQPTLAAPRTRSSLARRVCRRLGGRRVGRRRLATTRATCTITLPRRLVAPTHPRASVYRAQNREQTLPGPERRERRNGQDDALSGKNAAWNRGARHTPVWLATALSSGAASAGGCYPLPTTRPRGKLVRQVTGTAQWESAPSVRRVDEAQRSSLRPRHRARHTRAAIYSVRLDARAANVSPRRRAAHRAKL
jgi:hypothetical protein